MRAIALIGAFSVFVTGCASIFGQKDMNGNYGASTVIVNAQSDARKLLQQVPLESAMERFELLDAQGHLISYVAFTDTKVGGLVFIDGKLYGTVSHADAQAFYSCRGYVTALNRYWGGDADAWSKSLLARTVPASSVRLDFSGQATTKSLQEVVKYNPFVDQLRTLASVGANPLSLFKTLDRLHDNMVARERYETTLQGLSAITPGMKEAAVADVVGPDEVSFMENGMVMAYPAHLVEYYISDGTVKVLQQPSFNYLSRTQLTLFYVPNAQWNRCTPAAWATAFAGTNRSLWAEKDADPSGEKKDRAPKPNMASGLWSAAAPRPDATMRPGHYLGAAD